MITCSFHRPGTKIVRDHESPASADPETAVHERAPISGILFPAQGRYADAMSHPDATSAAQPGVPEPATPPTRTEPAPAGSRPLGVALDQSIAVLANPSAGRGRHAGALAAVLERLGATGHPVRVLDAPDRDGALAAAHRAVRDGVAALVSVGGDGTLHLGLQAVAGTTTPFGVVPCGTGNDFATQVGVPADPEEAAAAIARGLTSRQGRAVDLARMTAAGGGDPVWFGAVLGAGFDSIVNEKANRMRWPRGPRRYDVAILAELIRLRARVYTVTLDGVTREEPAVIVAVGNTASYGGGMRVCPDADPTDGLLDVVIGRPMSRWTMMRIKPSLYDGTHVNHPLVDQYRARTVTLAADGITTYADGERALPLPVTVEAVPGALTLVG
jgi:diacylglycerol kinase (ATP)